MKRFLLFFAALWLAGMSMMNASTCADLNAVTSTQGINFTLGQVTVVYAKAPYIYVQDATGTALVYSNWNVFKRLVPGDVVHSITGTAKLYSNLPELMPTDSMISKSSGTAPAIPDATAAPTTADINKVFIYRDVDMGSQSFPNGSAANKTGTFSGGSVLFRNAWKEAYQFDATKTYDILGCVSIYGSTIQVYAAEITEHHEMGFNPIVIGAEKPSAWGAMYLYAWKDNNEGTLLGAWPGTLVNVDSTGWAYKTFEGVSAVNYIWNNGSGVQTVDLYTDASICQRLVEAQPHSSSGNWTTTTVECGSHATQPSDTTVIGEPITVRLFPSSIVEGWESGNGVFLYAWTGDSTKVLGNWPGYPVDKVNGWYSYTFPAYIQNVNIIWSNGGMSTPNQTENILNVTASTCYRLGYRTTMIDDYATGNIHYEANVVDCSAETTLKTMYEVNQAADGTPIAVRPLIVTFAKKPYFYVQDFADTPGLIYDIRNEWTDLAFNDLITGFEGDVKDYNGLKEMVPSLSYVDWEVSNRTEYITIPTATSAPTTADMNKVFRFKDVSFGNAAFTTEKKINITATMANGETFAARNQWQEAYTFEANKTYDFTGCVAVYNGNVQVYATNFVEHAGPTPQPGDSTIQDTITLGFGNAFAWDSVYLYAWDDNQNPLLGQWPGTPMTLDSSQWAYKTFIGAGKINYIWNNGKYSSQAGARQTQDLTARASVCQAPDPFATNYPFGVVEIECEANPDFVFDLSFEQALAVGALADITNPSYYTYRTTGVVSNVLTSPENVDRYKNCDFFITNPTNPNDNSIECFRTRWLHDEAM
ncbi:MAG: starch-binding protein, partial [Paludibacteraceae bacterium]|nr:starch-binding protein [Paludibacteraceae bacterium]